MLSRLGFGKVIVLESELHETFGLNNDVSVFGASELGN